MPRKEHQMAYRSRAVPLGGLEVPQRLLVRRDPKGPEEDWVSGGFGDALDEDGDEVPDRAVGELAVPGVDGVFDDFGGTSGNEATNRCETSVNCTVLILWCNIRVMLPPFSGC
jgi:hypothetical protein